MSQRIAVNRLADPGTGFAAGAFDDQIGKTIPVDIGGRPVKGGGKVVSARVADDGKSVTLTVEVPDGSLPQTPLTSVSLGQ